LRRRDHHACGASHFGDVTSQPLDEDASTFPDPVEGRVPMLEVQRVQLDESLHGRDRGGSLFPVVRPGAGVPGELLDEPEDLVWF